MSVWKMVSLGLLLSFGCLGCDNEVEKISAGEMPPKWDLVGTWTRPSSNTDDPDDFYSFREDGTFSSEVSGVSDEGTWSLKGDVFSRTTVESGEEADENGDFVSYEETYTRNSTMGVVDEKLYFDTLNRVSKGGENDSGLWKIVYNESRTKTREGGGEETRREVFNLALEIDEDAFSAEIERSVRETGGEPPEVNEDTSDTLEGYVYRQGEFIGLGNPNQVPPGGLPEDLNVYDSYYYFIYFGSHVSDDVVVLSALSADQADARAFEKVK